MTAQNPPTFLQAGSHPAEDVRRLFSALTADAEGVLGVDDLGVSEAATPDMSVQVDSGRAFVKGDHATYQGSYFVENRGAVSLVVPASDSVSARIDLIVARVRDSVYSGADDEWDVELIAGTPSASPSPPSTPQTALPLAQVFVGASVSSIVNAAITDLRSYAFLHGGVLSAPTPAGRPGSPSEGQLSYVRSTDRLDVYDGSTWSPLTGRVGCTIRRSTSLSLAANTPTLVSFDVDDEDTDAFHSTSTSTSRITIPSGFGGTYSVFGTLRWDADVPSSRCYLAVAVNGIAEVRQMGTAVTFSSIAVSWTGPLSAGDYVEIVAFNEAAITVDPVTSATLGEPVSPSAACYKVS